MAGGGSEEEEEEEVSDCSWDQIQDPESDACAVMPASDAMAKFRDCLPPDTIVSNYWSYVSRINWNNDLGTPAQLHVPFDESVPLTLEINREKIISEALRLEIPVWQGFNQMLVHEMLHVVDAVEHGRLLWQEPGVEDQMKFFGGGSMNLLTHRTSTSSLRTSEHQI